MDGSKTDLQKTDDFSSSSIENLYNKGGVLTRVSRGAFQYVTSTRVDLEKFSLTSENRRIIRKVEEQYGKIATDKTSLPMDSYTWEIGKMAKDFYDQRGASFSANKIKEILTDDQKSNFNTLLSYTSENPQKVIGYAICLQTANISHYAYPFYDTAISKDFGLAMMIKAIELAKSEDKKYVYLGTLQRYKLQFTGFEWFDGHSWNNDTDTAKSKIDS